MMLRPAFSLLALCLLGPVGSAQTVDGGGDSIRVACVGDSITFGSGVKDRETNNYPEVLDRLLSEKYEVKNFGVSGATLLQKGDKPYRKESAFEKASAFAPHIVVIKLGTNDSKPKNWVHKDEFAGDLLGLIDHFDGLATKPRVVLCHPAPVTKTNFGINQPNVTEVGEIVKRVAAERRLDVVDLHAALIERPEYLPDGVHPNAEGAALIATAVAEVVSKLPTRGPKTQN